MSSLPDDFLAALESKYLKDLPSDKGPAAWATERGPIVASLEAIANHLRSSFHIARPIGLGGSGVTVLMNRVGDDSEFAVLKVARPAQGVAERLNKNLRKEIHSLRGLRHENVIRVYAFSEGVPEDQTPPYYVMEFLSGVSDADVFLRRFGETDPSNADDLLLQLVHQAVRGLEYIHQRNIIHLDLKPANLFVDESGLLVIADFGFAKRLDDFGMTSGVGGTKQYMHPEYFRLMTTADEDTRLLRDSELPRAELHAKWDLYSLGATVMELLAICDDTAPGRYSSYVRRYLRLLAARMMGGHISHARAMGIKVPSRILGLTERAVQDLSYGTATQVREDMQKLLGERDLNLLAPETSRYYGSLIQASSHSTMPFSPRVAALVETHEVRALGSLPQLGLVSLVYPTASHSRLEHTFGTFSMVCRYLRGLYNDPVNPLFRQIVSQEDIVLVMAASLVHDIGHYPLAHDLEEVDRSVFGHELRGAHLLEMHKTDLRTVLDGAEWGLDYSRLIQIVSPTGKLPLRDELLASILDGPIDADKLDYLIRDSENLRLPYGRGIDHERLVQHLTVAVEERLDIPHASIAIHENGRIAAESVAFARYAMYGAVYWHRTHRAAKAMLQRVAFEALRAWKSGDAVRKGGYKKELRSALYAFLDSQQVEQRLPGLLGELSPRSDAIIIDPGSFAVLNWLDEQGQFRANQLATDLASRRLFKRVLVMSRGYASPLNWEAVERLYGGEGERWEERLQASELLQRVVVARAKAFSARGEPMSSITPSDVDRFIVRSESEPLLLLDYPPDKPGTATGLRVLHERESSRPGDDDFSLSLLEQSSMWSRLRVQAPLSLAKLRVFCHPEFRAIIRTVVDRVTLEQLVSDSVNEVL